MPHIAALWYLSGFVCALVWPLVYFRNMEREDWVEFAKVWPIVSIFGPLALIAAFPV